MSLLIEKMDFLESIRQIYKAGAIKKAIENKCLYYSENLFHITTKGTVKNFKKKSIMENSLNFINKESKLFRS